MDAWPRCLERLQAEFPAEDVQTWLKPLQADLRDYQLTGFQWLCRLAHWGVGACLADDMGLGKTLQALALLLARAPGGPTSCRRQDRTGRTAMRLSSRG